MARVKEYNRDEVLEKAVNLFWQKGYKASSMADIVETTGLNTASMYKEFGDKDGLFEEALAYYQEHIVSHRIQVLIDQPNLKGIETFLKSVVDGAVSNKYKGCLMMNHLSQKNTISHKAARQISEFNSKMEGLLETAVGNAQTKGEIPSHKDPAVLASFVMCCVHGLVLYGRLPNKKEDVGKLYEVFVSVLQE